MSPLARAITLEWLAQLYYHASLLGEPALLDDAELARVEAVQKALADRRDQALLGRRSGS